MGGKPEAINRAPSTLSHRPHGLRWYYADIEEEEADSQYLKALPWWR